MTQKFNITKMSDWIKDQKIKYPHGIEGINFKRLQETVLKYHHLNFISTHEKNDMIRTLQMAELCYDKHKVDKKYRSIINDIENISSDLQKKKP